jgi:hypothetical protein
MVHHGNQHKLHIPNHYLKLIEQGYLNKPLLEPQKQCQGHPISQPLLGRLDGLYHFELVGVEADCAVGRYAEREDQHGEAPQYSQTIEKEEQPDVKQDDVGVAHAHPLERGQCVPQVELVQLEGCYDRLHLLHVF